MQQKCYSSKTLLAKQITWRKKEPGDITPKTFGTIRHFILKHTKTPITKTMTPRSSLFARALFLLLLHPHMMRPQYNIHIRFLALYTNARLANTRFWLVPRAHPKLNVFGSEIGFLLMTFCVRHNESDAAHDTHTWSLCASSRKERTLSTHIESLRGPFSFSAMCSSRCRLVGLGILLAHKTVYLVVAKNFSFRSSCRWLRTIWLWGTIYALGRFVWSSSLGMIPVLKIPAIQRFLYT